MRGCRCRIDDDEWQIMTAEPDASCWTCTRARPDSPFTLSVEARDQAGNTGTDAIHVTPGRGQRTATVGDGSDADRIGAWPERHLLDTQLGPNRNGRHW